MEPLLTLAVTPALHLLWQDGWSGLRVDVVFLSERSELAFAWGEPQCGSCFFVFAFLLCVTVLPSLQTLSPHLLVFGVFPFSVLHQSCAHEKINKSGRWGGWVSPLCSAPRYDDCVCVLRPTGSFFLFFCTSYFDAPFIRARIHSSFKPALKSFYFFVVLPKACANSGAGIIHMATGMHLGVTPQAVHHPPSYLCVPESFPSMQLESEIPCQLVASFLWPFLVPSLSLCM